MDIDKIIELLNKIKNEYVWVPLIVGALIVVMLMARFMLWPALQPSDKWATDVIHESEDGEYVKGILEELNE